MQAVNDLCNQMGNLNMQSPFIKKVNGHDDDIHALVKLAPTQFVSGSKDTKVKIWDFALQRQTECHSQHRKKGYESWVTAVAVVQDDLFVSATRDGFIDLWDFQGKSIGSLTYNPVVNTVSKNRNKMRIHCIAKNSFGTPGTFFTGASGCFQLWNSKEAVKTWTAHANDWVYCIEPLTEQRLITVI